MPNLFSGYQSEIYLNGMSSGARPKVTTDLSRLEAQAARVLSPRARRHLLSEAGGRDTLAANAKALRQWRIVPRMFRDHAERDLSTTILGVPMPAPVLFAPVARQTLAHPDGELASARAAAELELVYVSASDSGVPLEEVATAGGAGPRWYQIDWPARDASVTSRLRRARAAGFSHLVVTLPRSGPDWSRLRALRGEWDGPILLHGIDTAADAKRAAARGVDGIVVSNRRAGPGSRARGTVHSLPAIARAAGRRVAVLFDSGVETGTHAFKALALGADAVLVGRPYAYGLALDGESGARNVLRSLLAELELTLGNAGYQTHKELGPGSLSRAR